MSRDLDPLMAARVLRSELHPHWGRHGAIQWGVIVAIHPPGTYNSVSFTYSSVDVKLDGSTTTTPNLAYLENYVPLVNDWVVVLRMQGPAQTARIVVGSMSPPGTSSATLGSSLKIYEVTAGVGGVSNFSITIPSTIGGHLIQVDAWLRSNNASINDRILTGFNGDTGANYDSAIWYTQAASITLTQETWNTHVGPTPGVIGPGATAPSTSFAHFRMRVYSYTDTVTDKRAHIESSWLQGAVGTNNQFSATGYVSWRPATPAAITSILIQPQSGTLWAQNSWCTALLM